MMCERETGQTGTKLVALTVGWLFATACLLPPSGEAAPRQGQAPAAVAEALDLAKTARKVYEAKQFSAAAELWRKAFRLDPSKPDYLYGVGKAEQRAGNFAKAKAAFEQLLALLPGDDPLADRARKAMAEMAGAEPAAPAVPAPAPQQPPIAAAESPVGATAPTPAAALPASVTAAAAAPAAAATPPLAVAKQPAAAAADWPLWGSIGTTAAAAIAAGVMAGLAVAADSDAEPFRVAGTGEFDPALISEGDARSRVRTINDRWMWAGIGAGVAVASGGVAGWLGWQRSRAARRQTTAASAAFPAFAWSGEGIALTWTWP